MAFPGLQHVAITVSDLERSTQWYSRLFGAEAVLDEDEESGTFHHTCLLYTSPSPRDGLLSRMPSSA